MGLYDSVTVTGSGWTCPEGHDLTGEDWQTKDLGETMGGWTFGEPGSEIVESRHGAYNDVEIESVIRIYTSCPKCPHMLQAKTYNVLDLWVEYELAMADRLILTRKLISEPLAETMAYWLAIGGDGVIRTKEEAHKEQNRRWRERTCR